MGTVDITYFHLDADGESGAIVPEVEAVLLDTKHRTLSVLAEGKEYYFDMNNVQSIKAKGVEITYA